MIWLCTDLWTGGVNSWVLLTPPMDKEGSEDHEDPMCQDYLDVGHHRLGSVGVGCGIVSTDPGAG